MCLRRSRSIRPTATAFPPNSTLRPGQFVEVPLGRRHTTGRGLGGARGRSKRQSEIHRQASRLGAVAKAAARLSSIGFPAGRSRRAAWCCAWRRARPKGAEPAAPRIGVRKTGKAPARLTPARQRVLAALGGRRLSAEIRARRSRRMRSRRHRRLSRRRRSGSRRAGARAAGARSRTRILPRPNSSPTQAQAAQALVAAVDAQAFSATLLEGVTGSGKTEVYFEAVAAALRAGQTGADPAAGNRADRAISRSLRRALRNAPGRMAFGRAGAAARALCGAASPAARSASSPAPVRLCSCPSPNSASSSSMRSMKAPISRKRAFPITRAIWRWCARGWRARRSFSPRRRPRSKRASTPNRGAMAGSSCLRGLASARMPRLAAVDLRREGPPRGRWLSPRLIAGVEEGPRARRTIAAVPQPARLCAADAVPHLRPSLPMPQLLGLARRAPLSPRASLPPLRPCRKAPGHLPGMSGGRQPDRLRARRRAARGRGAGCCSRRRGCSFCPPIFPAAWSICAVNWRRRPKAPTTS